MRRTKQHRHKHVQVSGGAPAWHWFLKGQCIAWSYAPVPAPPSPVQGCCSECLALQPKPHPGCSCCSLALLVPRLPAPLAPLFFSSMCCSRWLFLSQFLERPCVAAAPCGACAFPAPVCVTRRWGEHVFCFLNL